MINFGNKKKNLGSNEPLSLLEMKKREKLRKVMLAKYITTKAVNVYNMTQDGRHVSIIDMRAKEEYDESFIRGSYSLVKSDRDAWSHLVPFMRKAEKKSEGQELKYGVKKIRRAVLVMNHNSLGLGKNAKEQQYKPLIQKEFKDFVDLCEKRLLDLDKVYILFAAFDQFRDKFPFLCLNKVIQFDLLKQQKSVNQVLSDNVTTNAEGEITFSDQSTIPGSTKRVMYSFAKFPNCLIENNLFVGSTFNMNTKRQLKDLGINSIVSINTYPIVKGEYNKKESESIGEQISEREGLKVTLNLEKYINFDPIIDEIQKLPKPVLLCCQSLDISPCIAVAYFQKMLKLDVTRASMMVFSKTGSTKVNSVLYTQILTYKPGNTFVKV